MKDSKWFAKPNLVIEPLYDRWYAWSHLISPATAAMNIKGRHLKIMSSYIQSPKIHQSAVKNPKMLGGPFMDFETERVKDIKDLKQETLQQQEHNLELADAIKELDDLLKSKGKGFSLESLYEEVPEILKGYVELVYDLNNNPSFRFFEPLLYGSEFFNKASQSIALWITDNDERPLLFEYPSFE